MCRTDVHACQCPVCQSEPSDESASVQALHHQMNLFLSRLNEQQRRWYAALESKRLGHAGDRQLSHLTGLCEKTIRKGRRELDAELAICPADRIRKPGGGRPSVEVRDPALESTLEEIVAPETAGDPQRRAKYKRSSLRHLSARLAEEGHPASPPTVERLLRKLGYSYPSPRAFRARGRPREFTVQRGPHASSSEISANGPKTLILRKHPVRELPGI